MEAVGVPEQDSSAPLDGWVVVRGEVVVEEGVLGKESEPEGGEGMVDEIDDDDLGSDDEALKLADPCASGSSTRCPRSSGSCREGIDMGGHAYWYYVPYEGDVAKALSKLREREFKAGRYSPVIRYMDFEEPTFSEQHPGPQHATIEEAIRATDAEGTRSILDISRIGDEPDYGVAAPLDADTLEEIYGTDRPTREKMRGLEFLEDVERGKCVYVLVYDENGKPTEVCFAGYSYD